MQGLCDYIERKSDFTVVNVGYPTTLLDIGTHARYLAHLIDGLEGVEEINFVAHSMGNIVIRHYLHDMISEGVDVGTVVTCLANQPLFIEQLPAVNISYGEEAAEGLQGSASQTKYYKKKLEALNREIAIGLDQVNRGECVEFDFDELMQEVDEELGYKQ